MNGVPTGRPLASSNAPSETMKSPPGKSPTPVLVRGTWKSGLPGSSDFGMPTACANKAYRNVSFRLQSNRLTHAAPGTSHGSPFSGSPDAEAGSIRTASLMNWKPVFQPTVPGYAQLTNVWRIARAPRADSGQFVDLLPASGQIRPTDDVRIGFACRVHPSNVKVHVYLAGRCVRECIPDELECRVCRQVGVRRLGHAPVGWRTDLW